MLMRIGAPGNVQENAVRVEASDSHFGVVVMLMAKSFVTDLQSFWAYRLRLCRISRTPDSNASAFTPAEGSISGAAGGGAGRNHCYAKSKKGEARKFPRKHELFSSVLRPP